MKKLKSICYIIFVENMKKVIEK